MVTPIKVYEALTTVVRLHEVRLLPRCLPGVYPPEAVLECWVSLVRFLEFRRSQDLYSSDL